VEAKTLFGRAWLATDKRGSRSEGRRGSRDERGNVWVHIGTADGRMVYCSEIMRSKMMNEVGVKESGGVVYKPHLTQGQWY
jgi:hypothetical protein